MIRGTARIRLIAVVALIAVLGHTVFVSAQSSDRGGGNSGDSIAESVDIEFEKLEYTATDDLWEWRDRGNQRVIESQAIHTMLSYTDSFGQIGLIDPGERVDIDMHHRMSLQLKPAPGSNGQRNRDLVGKLAKPVTVSGDATARLNWSIPDGDSNVILTALRWDAKVDGSGECVGDDCELGYQLTGKLSTADGQRNCGEMTLSFESSVEMNEQILEFKAGADLSSKIRLLADRDGTTCLAISAERDELISGDVGFDVGANGESFTLDQPTRVMPGDNVQIDYRNVPVAISQPDAAEGGFWDIYQSPVLMTQDMSVEFGFIPTGETAMFAMSGTVRGEFPSGVIAVGEISGRGALNDYGMYEIVVQGEFDMLADRGSVRCGKMSIEVTTEFSPGAKSDTPLWTFHNDGAGSIDLLNSERCILNNEVIEGPFK